jgi:hypothetical protein
MNLATISDGRRAVFVRRHRDHEVARVGQAIGADHAEVGQPQAGAEVLAHVAARRAVEQLDAEAHAARDHHDLLRLGLDHAQFGGKAQPALLQHDQQLAVGAVKVAIDHRAVARIQVDRAAALGVRIAGAGEGHETFNEIRWRRRDGQRIPAQLVGRRLGGEEVARQPAVVDALERQMHRRRAGSDRSRCGGWRRAAR